MQEYKNIHQRHFPGNASAIPILQAIGLGMGVLIWNVTNCLFGWASSRFGLFGLKANIPNNVALNYAGLALILGGCRPFFLEFKKTSFGFVGLL